MCSDCKLQQKLHRMGFHGRARAVQYDDIYRMDEIKSLSFHMFYCLFRGVAKHIVYGNTFLSFGRLRSLHATHHPPRGVKGRQKQVENIQPGHNEELVPKRETTSVAWTCVLKHCSLIQTDFKPLKHKQQSYMLAPSLCLCERSKFFFRFIGFELEIDQYGFFYSRCRCIEVRVSQWPICAADFLGRYLEVFPRHLHAKMSH